MLKFHIILFGYRYTYMKGSNLVAILPNILQQANLDCTDWESWPLETAKLIICDRNHKKENI